MQNKWLRNGAGVLGAVMLVGCIVVPIHAAVIATEEPMAGANVALEQYCSDVANGVTAAAPVDSITPTPQPAETPKPDEKKEKSEENNHVALNLNYSRLGIASKVDTYLNVRKKPSESSKVVGKLTKNAGCHVYKIKKGWAKIVSGKVTGWVKKSYMVFDEKAEKLATKVGKNVAVIDTEALIVRELPSTEAKIYSVVAIEEEFELKKENITKEFLEKIIKKNGISKKRVKAVGGVDKLCANLDNWICIKVDDEYAFVAKEYVKTQYTLKRAVKVGDIVADESSGVSSSQAGIVQYAKQFLGNPYRWGGTSLTNGTDCSGFVQSLYRRYGYSLPRTAASQAGATRKVSPSSAKPGDLFFYSNGSRINHVAMYIGGGMVIHASNPSDGIKISNAFYRQPVKVGRVMN